MSPELRAVHVVNSYRPWRGDGFDKLRRMIAAEIDDAVFAALWQERRFLFVAGLVCGAIFTALLCALT